MYTKKQARKQLGVTVNGVSRDLLDVLPSGSGFDTSWCVDLSKDGKTLLLYSSYHAMDDNGYYCGWADFTVKIPLDVAPSCWRYEFSLQFNGKYSHYLNSRYMLREYFEDTISYALEGIETATVSTTYLD